MFNTGKVRADRRQAVYVRKQGGEQLTEIFKLGHRIFPTSVERVEQVRVLSEGDFQLLMRLAGRAAESALSDE
jgi:hypothetical protein